VWIFVTVKAQGIVTVKAADFSHRKGLVRIGVRYLLLALYFLTTPILTIRKWMGTVWGI